MWKGFNVAMPKTIGGYIPYCKGRLLYSQSYDERFRHCGTAEKTRLYLRWLVALLHFLSSSSSFFFFAEKHIAEFISPWIFKWTADIASRFLPGCGIKPRGVAPDGDAFIAVLMNLVCGVLWPASPLPPPPPRKMVKERFIALNFRKEDR